MLRSPYYIEVAAVVAKEGLILVNEGLLTDESTFEQLDILLRHELAHALLQHQFRSCQRVDGYMELCSSIPLKQLFNIIADAEISNTRYTEADKAKARHIQVNAPKSAYARGLIADAKEGVEEVCGIVTEDLRAAWSKLSLEEMIDKLEEEINHQIKVLRGEMNSYMLTREEADKKDYNINGRVLAAYGAYCDTSSSSCIKTPIKKFVEAGCRGKVREGGTTKTVAWAKPYCDIGAKIYQAISSIEIDDSVIDSLLDQIANSNVIRKVTLRIGEASITLTTPEEKYAASEVVKACRSEYSEWYKKVYAWAKKASYYEIKAVLEKLGLERTNP